MIAEVQAIRAHTLHQRVLGLKRQVEAAYLELGAVLLTIREHQLYEAYADDFEGYLRLPELDFSRATAYKCMRAAKACMPLLESRDWTGPPLTMADMAAVGITKADIIAPMLADAPSEAIHEWVAKAQTLSEPDLRREVCRANGQDTERAAFLENLGNKLIALGIRVKRDEGAIEALDESAHTARAGRERLGQEYGA